MNAGIETITSNLGMSFENIALLVIVIGCIIFFARDFRVGVIVSMMLSALLFILCYNAGLRWEPSLIVFFIDLIVLALSLYGVNATAEKGGVV